MFMKPDYYSVGAMVLIFGLSLLWLNNQITKGSDNLLPRFMKKHKFNYLREMSSLRSNDDSLDTTVGDLNGPDSGDEQESQEVSKKISKSQHICAICMTPVTSPLLEEPQETGNIYYRRLKRYRRTHYMHTPCNHKFHIACLIGWMRVRMRCPTCRGDLPQLI